MAEYNLNKRFDEVAEAGVPYTLVSHETIELVGSDGKPYTAVIGTTTDNKRILFSGKVVVDGFANLVKEIGCNPYDCPKEFTLGHATARDGREYKVIERCRDV